MPEDKRVERVCEECGELFYGNVRQRLCAKCRVFRAEDRRLRERSRRKSNRLARLCKTCGTPIWDRGLQYCPDCRKPGDRPIREAACRTCGGPLMANETQQCAKCKAVMTETYHRILTQTGRAPTLRELDEAKEAASAAERAEASFAKERTVLQAAITAAEASAELSRRETAQLLEKQRQAKETIKKLKENPEIPKTTLDKLQAEARQKALKEAKAEQEARLRELETQAKEAAAAVDAAEREAKELKAKLAMASTDMAEFKAHFETTQGSVKRMLEVWSRIRDTDQATAERCRQAILAVARQMEGKVGA